MMCINALNGDLHRIPVPGRARPIGSPETAAAPKLYGRDIDDVRASLGLGSDQELVLWHCPLAALVFVSFWAVRNYSRISGSLVTPGTARRSMAVVTRYIGVENASLVLRNCVCDEDVLVFAGLPRTVEADGSGPEQAAKAAPAPSTATGSGSNYSDRTSADPEQTVAALSLAMDIILNEVRCLRTAYEQAQDPATPYIIRLVELASRLPSVVLQGVSLDPRHDPQDRAGGQSLGAAGGDQGGVLTAPADGDWALVGPPGQPEGPVGIPADGPVPPPPTLWPALPPSTRTSIEYSHENVRLLAGDWDRTYRDLETARAAVVAACKACLAVGQGQEVAGAVSGQGTAQRLKHSMAELLGHVTALLAAEKDYEEAETAMATWKQFIGAVAGGPLPHGEDLKMVKDARRCVNRMEKAAALPTAYSYLLAETAAREAEEAELASFARAMACAAQAAVDQYAQGTAARRAQAREEMMGSTAAMTMLPRQWLAPLQHDQPTRYLVSLAVDRAGSEGDVQEAGQGTDQHAGQPQPPDMEVDDTAVVLPVATQEAITAMVNQALGQVQPAAVVTQEARETSQGARVAMVLREAQAWLVKHRSSVASMPRAPLASLSLLPTEPIDALAAMLHQHYTIETDMDTIREEDGEEEMADIAAWGAQQHLVSSSSSSGGYPGTSAVALPRAGAHRPTVSAPSLASTGPGRARTSSDASSGRWSLDSFETGRGSAGFADAAGGSSGSSGAGSSSGSGQALPRTRAGSSSSSTGKTRRTLFRRCSCMDVSGIDTQAGMLHLLAAVLDCLRDQAEACWAQAQATAVSPHTRAAAGHAPRASVVPTQTAAGATREAAALRALVSNLEAGVASRQGLLQLAIELPVPSPVMPLMRSIKEELKSMEHAILRIREREL